MVAVLGCCLLGLGAHALAAPARLDRSNPAALDASFGKGGIVNLAKDVAERLPNLHAYAIDVAPGPDESVFVLSVGYECGPQGECRNPLLVTRYDAHGSPDSAYGDRGSSMLSIGSTHGAGGASIAVDSRGRALIAERIASGVHVVRLGADGNRDSSFGHGGEAVAPSSQYALSEIAVSADDGVVIESDWYLRHPHHKPGTAVRATAAVSVTRFLANGRLDRLFGHRGTLKTSFRRVSPPTALAVRPARGGILLAGRTCCSDHPIPYLARIRVDGEVDRHFGRLPGLRRLRRSQGTSVSALMLLPGGGIEIVGAVEWGRYEVDRRGFLFRLQADGTADRRFGRGGLRLPSLPIDAAANDQRGRIFAVFEEGASGEVAVFRLTRAGGIDRSFSGRNGTPVRGAGGGEGGLVAAYSGPHPLLFNPRIFTCRSTCPPAPVLVRFVG